jgi:hypothetical protein
MTHYPDMQCTYIATFYVHPMQHPSKGKFGCTQHLAKVCRTMAAGTAEDLTAMTDTVTVIVLRNNEGESR